MAFRRKKLPADKDYILKRLYDLVEAEGDCLIWKGRLWKGKGSGLVCIKHQNWVTHHLAWWVHFGRVPDSWLVSQTCGNKLCLKPEHLKLIHKSEVVDREAIGRWSEARWRTVKRTTKNVVPPPKHPVVRGPEFVRSSVWYKPHGRGASVPIKTGDWVQVRWGPYILDEEGVRHRLYPDGALRFLAHYKGRSGAEWVEVFGPTEKSAIMIPLTHPSPASCLPFVYDKRPAIHKLNPRNSLLISKGRAPVLPNVTIRNKNP